ncbi:MAG: ATP-binding protein [Pseudonocardiaceae bacterium]
MRRRAIGVRLPFVARAGVVTYAGAALDAARRSRGILLVVTGEPGVGKSRLAEEVAARAEDRVDVCVDDNTCRCGHTSGDQPARPGVAPGGMHARVSPRGGARGTRRPGRT